MPADVASLARERAAERRRRFLVEQVQTWLRLLRALRPAYCAILTATPVTCAACHDATHAPGQCAWIVGLRDPARQ
jgi:hypothetical protein